MPLQYGYLVPFLMVYVSGINFRKILLAGSVLQFPRLFRIIEAFPGVVGKPGGNVFDIDFPIRL